MVEISRPWTGTATGDAGPYTFDQWTDVWTSMFTVDNVIQGVLRGQGGELAVTGTSSPVDIAAGEAIVDGTWYDSSAAATVAVPTPAGSTRIDLIVLEKDWTAQTVRLARVAGTEGAGAPSVTQVDGTTWQIKQAEASITTGGTITVTDFREFNVGLVGKKVENVALADNDALHYRTGSGQFENTKLAFHNFSATVAPTVNEDANDGYSVGSLWLDVTNDRAYICKDATVAAAIWRQFASAGYSEIADASPSAVASVTVTSIPGTGGDLHIVGFLLPVTDGVNLELILNNRTAAGNYDYAVTGVGSDGVLSSNGSLSATEITMNPTARPIGNVSTEGIAFHIEIPNYAESIASEYKHTILNMSYWEDDPRMMGATGGGNLAFSEAITEVGLSFSSGNISSGHIRAYLVGD